MIKVKRVSIKKNKCHTININDLDPCLLDIKKKSSKGIDIITLITFKKILIVVVRCVQKLIPLQVF